jgi:hypothetical protein
MLPSWQQKEIHAAALKLFSSEITRHFPFQLMQGVGKCSPPWVQRRRLRNIDALKRFSIIYHKKSGLQMSNTCVTFTEHMTTYKRPLSIT